MNIPQGIEKISQLKGVHAYILVNTKARIITHSIQNPDHIAPMISFCGQQARFIGKTKFKYMVFPRDSQRDLLIFPVGNFFLGVIKSKETKAKLLADGILKIINSLLVK